MTVIDRNALARAIVNAGLTYSVEVEPVYLRESVTLNDVVDAIVKLLEAD